MAILLDGTNGLDSPDLNITGTGARITGDFSNATPANRVLFQTSTTNGATEVGVIPNGTSSQSSLRVFNATDPANANSIVALCNATEARLLSNAAGTATAIPLTMYTGGVERLRITTAGVVELTSGQLKFPATQNASGDANTLDDYEEGTFTPTIRGSNSDPTITYTSQSGRYVKVGKMITVQFDVRWSAKSGGSGTLFIGGLPFTADAGYNFGVLAEKSGLTLDASYTYVTGEVAGGTTSFYPLQGIASGASSGLLTANLGSAGYLIGGASIIAA